MLRHVVVRVDVKLRAASGKSGTWMGRMDGSARAEHKDTYVTSD
jgi:hypothetical protein